MTWFKESWEKNNSGWTGENEKTIAILGSRGRQPLLVLLATANTEEDFIGMCFGVIHHVVNEHEWILPYKVGARSSCLHGPLTEERDKGWLEPGSPASVALRNIVRDKRLVKKIPYYLNCRSTAAFENFKNLILKYTSKQHSYTPPVYNARNLIAALDHNSNCDRDISRKKNGS
ncbi:uncharacterized protein [Magallana gigas]|uniref:uncharacterized protein n=1 Tax=Magallana gigas TaxID=29159 RepID=UPI00333E8C9D